MFLSIGYSACHWCHVMERESFEKTTNAKILNERFVAIKVDREERPDVDAIYMEAVQAMSGSGGWPMSVFLTPAGDAVLRRNVFSGRDTARAASFRQVLEGNPDAWATRSKRSGSGASRLIESSDAPGRWRLRRAAHRRRRGRGLPTQRN